MSYEPLKRWRCDVCGGWIEAADKGYVRWLTGPEGVGNFEVVHQGDCDDGEAPYALALRELLGPDGLARLTALLSPGLLKAGMSPAHLVNLDQWVDLVRRLQLPYYEEARERLQQRSTAYEHAGWDEAAPYLQENLHDLASIATDLG